MSRRLVSVALWIAVIGSVTFLGWGAVEAVHVVRQHQAVEERLAYAMSGPFAAFGDTTVPVVAMEAGQTEPMYPARVAYDEGSEFGFEVEWSSSDTSVVQVDSLGRVTARSPGYALITARVGDDLDRTIVHVSGGPNTDTGRVEGDNAEPEPSGPNASRGPNMVTWPQVARLIDERIKREHELGMGEILLVVLDNVLTGLGFLIQVGILFWIGRREGWDLKELIKP